MLVARAGACIRRVTTARSVGRLLAGHSIVDDTSDSSAMRRDIIPVDAGAEEDAVAEVRRPAEAPYASHILYTMPPPAGLCRRIGVAGRPANGCAGDIRRRHVATASDFAGHARMHKRTTFTLQAQSRHDVAVAAS